MDFFYNRKQREALETKVEDLQEMVNNLQKAELQDHLDIKELQEPRCFKMGDSLPEDSLLEVVARRMRALEKYLNVEITWEYEDDPAYGIPKPRQIRVWKATKKKDK